MANAASSPGHRAYPASPGQERVWLGDQLITGKPVQVIAVMLHVRGLLDVDALKAAVGDVVARHEILRSRFSQGASHLMQVVDEPGGARFTLEDLTSLPLAERYETARRLAASVARRLVDLAEGPVFETWLFQLHGEEHLLLFKTHQIVWDGSSFSIFADELATLYSDHVGANGRALSPLPLQYGDYAAGQRTKAGEHDGQLDYWIEQLRGVPHGTALIPDRPRPKEFTYRGATHRHALGRALREELIHTARSVRATVFMVALAGIQALLHAQTGERDIVLGSPVEGRLGTRLEPLIGFFVNPVVLRTEVTRDLTFLELIDRAKNTALEALANRDVPFERVLASSDADRDRSHAPLFQIMFTFHNEAKARWELGRCEIVQLPLELGVSQYDLTLSLTDAPMFELEAEYCTDIFEEGTIGALAEQLAQLYGAATEDPSQSLRSLFRTISGPSHRKPPTGTTICAGLTVLDAVAKHVAASPDHPAIIFGDASMSYAELDFRARRVGAALRGLGARGGSHIGIWMGRSLDAVVSILGVLYAGCVYVPLDPTYPLDRLRTMAAEAEVCLILGGAQEAGAQELSVRCLDVRDVLATVTATAPPASQVRGADPAYLMFTSGSSGRPKGVVVTHANLARSTFARLDVYPDPVGRFLLLSPLSFDSSVAGIFWTLCSGGTLVLAPPGVEREPREVVSIAAKTEATHLLCIPRLYEALLDEGVGDIASMSVAILAGERCGLDLLRRTESTHPATYVEWGPTEATVWCSVHRHEGAPIDAPLGRPVEGTRLYLLRDLDPLPVGAVGELYVGGETVAVGYLGQPDETAAQFLPDPFVGGGARMYRTGDLARERSDGILQFLGRIDDQVKIRGYRIELAEVEEALRANVHVRDACVSAVGVGGSIRLVAFVVTAASPAELDLDTRAALPEFMVPSHFVVMERLPRLPNGKVDRRALPDSAPPTKATGPAPEDEVSRVLADIWAKVLGVDNVGLDAHFFALGGHSLLAFQVVAEVRRRLGVDIAVRDVFEHRVLGDLARALEPRHLR